MEKLYQCVSYTKANIRIPSSHQQHNMLSSSSLSSPSSNAGTISSSIDGNDNKPHQQQQSQRPEFVLSVKEYLYHHAQTTTNEKGSNNDDNESLSVQQIHSKSIQFILASQSPRRKEILDMMGLQNRYSIIPSPLNETFVQNLLRNNYNDNRSINPMHYVRTLAEQKAYAVAYDINSNFNIPCTTLLILGSDTIVVLTTTDTDDDTSTVILEKPKDQKDAMEMLQSLQGRSHQVYTGVAIVQVTINQTKDENDTSTTTNNNSENSKNGVLYQDGIEINTTRTIRLVQSFVECSTVYMSRINSNDIVSYITKTNEPYDKAGAYGIQGIGGQYITKIDGDFFNVMGLPMHQTSRALTSAILDIVDSCN